MARFRDVGIAGLAVSALALTTTAVAYARDLGLEHATARASTVSSMSWAHYSGELTDLSPNTGDVFDGARATAVDDRHGR